MGKKKYTIFYCRDCDLEYFISNNKGRTYRGKSFCPLCGDNLFTEKLRNLWLERSVNYKKKWTDEEDQLLLAGLKLKKTHREIAKELEGRTENSVRHRASQLKNNKVR